jgi:hypothetical protein
LWRILDDAKQTQAENDIRGHIADHGPTVAAVNPEICTFAARLPQAACDKPGGASGMTGHYDTHSVQKMHSIVQRGTQIRHMKLISQTKYESPQQV